MTIDQALDSYLNGNFTTVRDLLTSPNAPFTFSELFDTYLEWEAPTYGQLSLFVTRLTR